MPGIYSCFQVHLEILYSCHILHCSGIVCLQAQCLSHGRQSGPIHLLNKRMDEDWMNIHTQKEEGGRESCKTVNYDGIKFHC